MPTLEEDEAFSRLRAKQGAGARYDADNAPAQELAWARRGTAYFARLLNNLRDRELYSPSAVNGWTRAHVVAAVAFNARDITRIVEAARLQLGCVETPTAEDRIAELSYAATLPSHALRNLFKHSEVHLNVEWRDLSNDDWQAVVMVSGSKRVTLSTTPLMRAQTIWSHAIDLGCGGQTLDIPLGIF
jgi:maleylpyruvate isomerase